MDRIQFRDLYLLLSKVFGKLQERGLLRPLDPQTIPNLLPKGVRHQSKVCLLLGPQLLYRSLLFSQACHLKIWLKKKLLWNYATTQSRRINCLFEEESLSKKPKKNQGSQFRIVLVSALVQVHPLFRTGKNTGRTGKIRQFRQVKMFRTGTNKKKKEKEKEEEDENKWERERKR